MKVGVAGTHGTFKLCTARSRLRRFSRFKVFFRAFQSTRRYLHNTSNFPDLKTGKYLVFVNKINERKILSGRYSGKLTNNPPPLSLIHIERTRDKVHAHAGFCRLAARCHRHNARAMDPPPRVYEPRNPCAAGTDRVPAVRCASPHPCNHTHDLLNSRTLLGEGLADPRSVSFRRCSCE